MVYTRFGSCGALLVMAACTVETAGDGTDFATTSTTGQSDDVIATTIPLPTATEGSEGSTANTAIDSSSGGSGTTSASESSTGPGNSSSDSGGSGTTTEDTGDPVSYDVSWCILQFPASVSVEVDEIFEIYVRLFAEGLTDLSGVNDPAPELVVELGYGLDGSDPSLGLGGPWAWVGAAPNDGYGPAAPDYSALNDEYWGDMTIGIAGIYDFAARVSGDGGGSWVYCDLDGLSEGGYTPDQAGHAEVGQ